MNFSFTLETKTLFWETLSNTSFSMTRDISFFEDDILLYKERLLQKEKEISELKKKIAKTSFFIEKDILLSKLGILQSNKSIFKSSQELREIVITNMKKGKEFYVGKDVFCKVNCKKECTICHYSLTVYTNQDKLGAGQIMVKGYCLSCSTMLVSGYITKVCPGCRTWMWCRLKNSFCTICNLKN